MKGFTGNLGCKFISSQWKAECTFNSFLYLTSEEKKRKEKNGVFTDMWKVNMLFSCSISVSHCNATQSLNSVESLLSLFCLGIGLSCNTVYCLVVIRNARSVTWVS